ncbi:MAG: amidohydrolase family protein [Acidobacteria bacterium]|jgi:predicted amidohydrolase YtcJ|nr:amidohydrolase family protein [Acidobacteriota bacterium]
MTQKISIPLLKDHHNHASLYALFNDCLNIQDIKDKKEASARIKSLPGEKVSVVLGWNTGFYSFTEDELNRFPPVIIVNLSLHTFTMNTSAEEMLKEQYPDIVGNYKHASWYESHFARMMIFLANQVEPTDQKVKMFFDDLYKKGVYHVEDMLLTGTEIFHLIQSSPYRDRTAFWTDPTTFKTFNPEVKAAIKGIKLFTDGALGAGTAALAEPYLNGKKAGLLHEDKELYNQMQEVALLGKAVSVHAIGELAIAQVLRTVRELKEKDFSFPEVRIEHCQFIDEAMAHEAKRLKIILSMQPNFSVDSVIYGDRLGQRYLEQNNPFRMLIDKAGFEPGKDLIFGSDGMPHGVEAAIRTGLFPPFPQQRLNLDEFIAGYCMPDKTYGQIEFEIDEKQQRGFLLIL